MTQLLEEAIAKLQQLPPEEQDAMAQVIMAELDDEQQWDEAFALAQDKLAELAAKVRLDVQTGKVRSLGIDEL